MSALMTTASPSSLSIRLFGPLDIQVAGKPMVCLRSRKEEWLMALLALRNGKEVSRDWLAGTLWPDNPEEQSLAYLRQTLYHLKKTLGEEAIRLQAPNPRVLRLDIAGIFVDVVVFDEAVKQNDASSLETAIALYRGPLLEGCSEEWAHLERQVREQAYLRALETLAEGAIARQEPASALPSLRLLIQRDPLRESAHRALMQALADDGDFAAMTLAYRDLRILLRREVNTDPAAETTALYQQLRAEAQRRATQRSAATGLPEETAATAPEHSDMKEAQAETEFQQDSAAMPSPPGRIVRIPRPLTHLIGRAEVVEATLNCLTAARLVTLTGTGGVGKTRIALQAAQTRAREQREDVWFVELASLSSESNAAQAVAQSVGLTEERERPLEETLAAFFSPRTALLVLDNCEHLISSCADLCLSLLHSCEELRILTTSRQALGVLGEITYPLPPMEVPPALLVNETGGQDKALLAVYMEHEAVRLFVERAQAVAPVFRLTTQNVAAVGGICRRLEGIPLAIELAAARVKALSVEQIQERLDNRYRLLASGNRAGIPHHQTLRALIDWSYDLLTEPEKILLHRLSVFAGGWTLELAEQVCSDAGIGSEVLGIDGEAANKHPIPNTQYLIPMEEVLGNLISLVDKSLVIAEPHTGEPRYRILETIREYAAEKLESSGEQERLSVRFCQSLLDFVERLKAQYDGPGGKEVLQRIESEYANLQESLARSLNPTFAPEMAFRFCAALNPYWVIRGYYREGLTWCEAACSRSNAQHRTAERARTLTLWGSLSLFRGDTARAYTLNEEALAIRQEIGNPGEIARSLNRFGLVLSVMGNHGESRKAHEESVRLFREIGDRTALAVALIELGNVLRATEEYRLASRAMEESLEISRSLGHRMGVAHALVGLGNLARIDSDYEKAARYYEEGLALSQELGDQRGIGVACINLGIVAEYQGDLDKALGYMRAVLKIWREAGDLQRIPMALEVFARIAFAWATPHTKAADLMQRSVRLWGAADAARARTRIPRQAGEQTAADETLHHFRAQLGTQTFEQCWKEGQEMSLEQALAQALENA